MREKAVKFDLINNAKDSLGHAVEHLTNEDKVDAGDLKRAIRDVAHVIELLLKERLRRVHPAFIWQDVDKYPSSTAYTVSTLKAVERLIKIAGIPLSDDNKQIIYSCKKIRDSIEHYEFELDLKEAKGIIGRMLSFIFDFSKSHLNLDLEYEFRENDRWKELIEIYEFWEAHSAAMEKQLMKSGKPVWDCPSCGASTFDLSLMRCIFCGHSEERLECNICHKEVWESDIKTIKGLDGDEQSGAGFFSMNICRDCSDKHEIAEIKADALRDMQSPP